MFRFRRHRDFALLWSGQLGSLLGDSLFITALVLYAYNASRSPTLATEVLLAGTAPRAILGTFTGVLADRADPRRLIIGADGARALMLLPLLAIDGQSRLWLIFPVTVINGCLGSVFQPAYSALLPATVPREQLARANAFNGATRSTVSIAGPPLGAATLATTGLPPLIVIDAISFVGSVMTVALMRTHPPARQPARYRQHLADGLRVARQHRIAAVIITSSTVFGLAGGMISAVAIPFFRQTLHASTAATGAILAASGIGAVAGGVLAGALLSKIGARRGTVVSDVSCFATFLGVAAAPDVPIATAALSAVGATNGLYSAAMNTLMQTTVPADFLGRVYGVLSAVTSTAALISGALPVLLLQTLSIREVLIVADVVAAAGALVTVVGLISQPARDLDVQHGKPAAALPEVGAVLSRQ